MLLRVNPIVLLGLIIVSVLTTGVLASALSGGGGTASDALGAAESQMGKPFVMGTDGPDTFSCVGLMRYALRTAGVDPDAPWVPEEYLSRYAPVAPGDLQPGDIVIFPGWATMYAGNGQVVNANEAEGRVTHTSMDAAGQPLGIVRPPYGGGGKPAQQPVPSTQQDPAIDPVTDPVEPQLPSVGGQVPLDGGQVPLDGGQVPLDGGQVPLDGGQVPLDGGQVPLDGQVPAELAPTDLPAG
jgi:hypothetical protein